ncbi:MAG: polysaccharide biosynthesis tyrosine autokinase [Bacilli bacterium]
MNNNNNNSGREITIEDILVKIKQNLLVIILIFVVVIGLGFAITKFALTPYYEGVCIMSVENQTMSTNTPTVAKELIDRLSTQTKYEGFLQSIKDQASDEYSVNRSIGALRQSISIKKTSADTIFSVNYKDIDPLVAKDICNLMAEEIKVRVNEEFSDGEGGASMSWAYQYATIKIENLATLPSSPVSPRTSLNVFISFVVALILALVYVVLKSVLSMKFASSVEVKELTGEDVITRIMGIKAPKKEEAAKKFEFVVKESPDSVNAEGYRKIPFKLLASVEKEFNVVQITSSVKGEFKTTTSINLAYALNEFENKKILIIDMDLRRPEIHNKFELDNKKGISNYVLGEVKLDEIIQKTADGIDIITSGKRIELSHVLVANSKVKEMIDELRKNYDVIILDCPPVLATNDAMIISKYADETLFVLNQKRVTKKEAIEALNILKSNNVKIAGIVMNNVVMEKRKSYYSYDYK